MIRPYVYITVALTVAACAFTKAKDGDDDFVDPPGFAKLVERAEVWHPTRVSEMNLRSGPAEGAFAHLETVKCTWVDEKTGGTTPKFNCKLPDGDTLKVKYGKDNGEIYAEVAATRLLWALGFGADRMYPVKVECQGCPLPKEENHGATSIGGGVLRFDYAAIERKGEGTEFEGPLGAGWSWEDLDRTGKKSAKDAEAHRDALKLLAVIMQHTDSKREQQRLVCLSEMKKGADPKDCERPFMLISDLGKTFGKANKLNRDTSGSVNLEEWASTPVWVGDSGCVGNIDVSVTGTLNNPKISEAGRRFLADLLSQLTDAQLRDLFEGARFPERAAGTPRTGDTNAWVAAFKHKVNQVQQRSCPAGKDHNDN
jgi:hypothetical protein